MTILIIFGCTTTKRTNDLHESTEQRKEGFSEKDLLKEEERTKKIKNSKKIIFENKICYCGNFTLPNDPNQKRCGIWYKVWDPIKDQPLIAFQENSQECKAKECQTIYKERKNRKLTCSAFELWTESPKNKNFSSKENKCYCDIATIEQNNETIEVCAIWKEGSQDLLEYHQTNTCTFADCQNHPFKLSSQICPNGFIKFFD